MQILEIVVENKSLSNLWYGMPYLVLSNAHRNLKNFLKKGQQCFCYGWVDILLSSFLEGIAKTSVLNKVRIQYAAKRNGGKF